MVKKPISNERIIRALVSSPTIKSAAASIGCSERTIYSRLKDEGFMEEYRAHQDSQFEETCNSLALGVTISIEFLTQLVGDASSSPTLRLTAARLLLEHYCKVSNALYQRRTQENDGLAVEDSDAYFRSAELLDSEREELEEQSYHPKTYEQCIAEERRQRAAEEELLKN